MALPTVPLTELDAVNIMLANIGEQPANQLDESGISEVSIAQQMLHNVSRQIQAKGLRCNSETNYTLPLDVNGEIILPSNTLKVDASDPSLDVCQRDGKLYDREKHTFIFTKPVDVDITFFLPFEQLPQSVRDYITIVAARQFQVRWLGSETLSALTEDDERKAYLALIDEEIDTGDFNIFNSYDTAMMLRR